MITLALKALALVCGALALALACALLWGTHERQRAQGWADYAHRLERASAAARTAQDALRAQERTTYQEQAVEADANHAAGMDRARALTRRFMDANRVQPARSCSAALAVSEADPASVRADVPADSVVVGSDDVRACGDWVAYGVALRSLAVSVSQ